MRTLPPAGAPRAAPLRAAAPPLAAAPPSTLPHGCQPKAGKHLRPLAQCRRRPLSVAAAAVAGVVPADQPASSSSPKPRVAYQGVPGAYSEAAAMTAVPGGDPLPCDDFETAFRAVAQWLADAAVLPVENSLGGSIHAVYDLLLRHEVAVVGEVAVRVEHCLMALPGTALASVTSVASHPQALAQCDAYLRSLGVDRVAADDTAGAARELATSGGPPGRAALASARAASLYGLAVLGAGVQDSDSNVTRFLVLARDAAHPAADDARPHKTSLAFSLAAGPGQLFKALSVFALRDIDMTKIESRPAPAGLMRGGGSGGGGASASTSPSTSRPFSNTIFYVDVAANSADPRTQNALRHLREVAPFCRVLGCYPAAGPPASSLAGGNAAAAVVGDSGVAVAAAVAAPSAAAAEPAPAAPPAAADLAHPDAGAGPPVAYQGVPGAYSEAASLAAVPGCRPVPCAAFESAFQALASRAADRAVVPIENSVGGSIHAVYDLLLRYRLHVVGETALAVDHCLAAPRGATLASIRSVASHPQALAQCDAYLRALGVARVAADDAAGAAAAVAARGRADEAALASARAASLYGLDVLATSVQDAPVNVTRFLVLARDPAVSAPSSRRAHKTSIVLSLPDGPGQLFKVLSVFALRDIDLAKVESRPARDAPLGVADGGGAQFGYLFYVDALANLADAPAQAALRHLQEIAPFMRVLGCYPVDGGEEGHGGGA